VCSPSVIKRWADALASGTDDVPEEVEAEMPRRLPLSGLGHLEFNLLAQCAEGGTVGLPEAAGALGLFRAVSEEPGPWVTAFRQPAIEATARMKVDHELLDRWAKSCNDFTQAGQEYQRSLLTVNPASGLKEMCGRAVKAGLGVFTGCYG
jgi:hypothetical protein